MPIWSPVARLDDRKRVVICTAKHECQPGSPLGETPGVLPDRLPSGLLG